MPLIASVAVEAASYTIDKPYDYLAPEEWNVQVGSRVLVPFGRGNRVSEGVVLALNTAVPERPIKAIRQNLDPEPLLRPEDIRLALWMVKRYFCTFYDALHTILPAAVWYRYREWWSLLPKAGEVSLEPREEALRRFLGDRERETQEVREAFGEPGISLLHKMEKDGIVQHRTDSKTKVQDKVVSYVRLALSAEEARQFVSSKGKNAQRMVDAVNFLLQSGETALHDLCYYTGATRRTVKRLEELEVVSVHQEETYRLSIPDGAVSAVPIALNDEQQQVFESILSECRSGQAGVTLLQGVTGSGKTLIYIRLAQELLKEGKSIMILVPEIALTPQMMARFTAYFGEEVALLHSGLRMSERYDQWKRLKRGQAHIVLGTRSAVFAPLNDLGLVIMDEEQESSYESENAPCYHARDIAKYRCAQVGARLLLGSATPTVETAYYAGRGDYHLALLRRRYNEQALPQVVIADMRKELRNGNLSAISTELYEELRENIARGEQSILFLNRRGASRELQCPACGYVPQCPRCSVYLTYHSANSRLMCHYCGYSEKADAECPECGGQMRRLGFGTQKVEEELGQLFPGTKVLRMDADTVGMGHEAILKQFEEEKVPILLGTQMVAKGLDFENVTLVGVLAADLSLYVDHYRAAERTFSLLTQVVGRAGRGEKKGRAVIQTFTPKNETILAAAAQDYGRFYESEIRIRQLRRDPPFADQVMVTVTGEEESAVRRAAVEIRDSLCAAVQKPPYAALDLEILGPAPAPIVKLNNRYRYRVTVIGKNDKILRDLLSAFMREFARRKEHKNMGIYTDCNLME